MYAGNVHELHGIQSGHELTGVGAATLVLSAARANASPIALVEIRAAVVKAGSGAVVVVAFAVAAALAAASAAAVEALMAATGSAPPGPESVASPQQNFLFNHQPAEQYPCFKSEVHSVAIDMMAMFSPINSPR